MLPNLKDGLETLAQLDKRFQEILDSERYKELKLYAETLSKANTETNGGS